MQADLSNRRLESKLIITGCQTEITPKSRELLVQLLQEQLDWQYVLSVIQRNAVKPLFSSTMLRFFSDRLPPDIRSMMEKDLQLHLKKNLLLTQKVLGLVKFFSENGIDALPFKGPMLAIQAYRNPALRQYGDLDLLVQPRHFELAVMLLKGNGYMPLTSVSWLKKRNWYVSRKKDIYFIDESGTVSLELHWKLSGSHFGLPKEMNHLWDRLETVYLAGTEVPALSFNDLLIYLCLHGSRHSWERLSWISDINELIRSQQEIDWTLFLAEAKRLRCEKVVGLGLRLIYEFFGFDAPVPNWDAIKRDTIYTKMVEEIRDRLFSQETKTVKIGERYLYHLKLKERPSDRWKLHIHYLSWYLRIIITPNAMDTNILHFPKLLYPLYYVTRPLRLIYTYLIKPKKENVTLGPI